MAYLKVFKEVYPKSSHHKEENIFHLYEMMNVNKTDCGKHFTVYVSQVIMLYILNIYSGTCQLYLNKTGKRKKRSRERSSLGRMTLG